MERYEVNRYYCIITVTIIFNSYFRQIILWKPISGIIFIEEQVPLTFIMLIVRCISKVISDDLFEAKTKSI